MTSNDMQFFSSKEERKPLFKSFFISNQVEILSLSIIAITTMFVLTFSPSNRVVVQQRAATNNTVPNNLIKPAGSTASVSQNVIQWVKSQKNSNGVYNYNIVCLKTGCLSPTQDGRVGLNAIWAFFNDYQINKNTNDLTEIFELLNFYNYSGTGKQAFMMQNIFYNCKWMYEMFQSGSFSVTQKNLIKNICINKANGYNPSFLNSSDITLWKNKFSQSQISAGKQVVMQNYSKTVTESTTEEDQFIKLSAFASDFSYKYLFDNTKTINLDLAKAYFSKAFDYYTRESSGNFYYGKCVLGTAATDLYKVTNDNSYLTFAKNLVEKEQLLSGCQTNSSCLNSTFEKATCSILAKNLLKLSGSGTYGIMKNTFNSQLMSNLDLTSYGYKYGKGSFWNKYGEDYNYSIRDNGLALEAMKE